MVEEQRTGALDEGAMIDASEVQQLRSLAAMGWGAKRIAKELGVARNTVRRYLRGGDDALTQERPTARRLDEDMRALAVSIFHDEAGGNAAVVHSILRKRGVRLALRTVQRALADERSQLRAKQVATVRVETEPGQQMQIDFGQKIVRIGLELVGVYFLVAVLSYSRRIFVKAFLAERQDEWREGVALAFARFGGVPREVLGDNASALVTSHNRSTREVRFHPAWVEFCKQWNVTPKTCAPYRARTKGKTESGVKYVKNNAIANRPFDSFAQLEEHLSQWMSDADQRAHGTTHQSPMQRFEEHERAALQPLPTRPVVLRERRLRRKVANDCFVDVDTIRYSVPHRLVGTQVEVLVKIDAVEIFRGAERITTHRRGREPHEKVAQAEHLRGLWRSPEDAQLTPKQSEHGRSLDSYAAVVAAGGAR